MDEPVRLSNGAWLAPEHGQTAADLYARWLHAKGYEDTPERLEAFLAGFADRQPPEVEYGELLSSGGYQTWNTEPYIEKIYPLAERLEHHRQHGKVYRRQIIVLDDWTEVTEP